MGIFDSFKSKKGGTDIDGIKSKDYRQKYFRECKYIWKNYVPKNGQAKCLQGELLREIEKIRCEAQDNGNINWDDEYSYFCDFISKSLVKQDMFSETEKEEIIVIMSFIKERGEYAQKFISGAISEKDVDMEKIAYVNDNLYDIICDKIGKLQRVNPEPIYYKQNDSIRR